MCWTSKICRNKYRRLLGNETEQKSGATTTLHPSVLFCISGSRAAEAHPSVIELRYNLDRVPVCRRVNRHGPPFTLTFNLESLIYQTVGGRWSTQREPTQTWGEYTQREPRLCSKKTNENVSLWIFFFLINPDMLLLHWQCVWDLCLLKNEPFAY